MDLINGTHVEAALVIFAIGTTPRDDLAKDSGIDCHTKGGVIVADDLTMSAKDVLRDWRMRQLERKHLWSNMSWRLVIADILPKQQTLMYLCSRDGRQFFPST